MRDGRIFVTSMGKERFEIKKVTKEKPGAILLLARFAKGKSWPAASCSLPALSKLSREVEYMNEEEDSQEANSEEAKELAKEVADLMRATIRLNVKASFRPDCCARKQCEAVCSPVGDSLVDSCAVLLWPLMKNISASEDQLEPEGLADLPPKVNANINGL
eukprot:1145772-Pelagomonas_calceolata.AAC.3